MIRTREGDVSKYSASAFVIAALALPSSGGSVTETAKLFSEIFSIFGILARGLALTKIFTLF